MVVVAARLRERAVRQAGWTGYRWRRKSRPKICFSVAFRPMSACFGAVAHIVLRCFLGVRPWDMTSTLSVLRGGV